MKFRVKMPFQAQFDQMDCGPSCLKMVTEYYDKKYSLEYLREISYLTREGVSLLSINDAAEELGFRTLMVKLSIDKLLECPTPCILHWNQNHYVVFYGKKINYLKSLIKGKFHYDLIIGDPAEGIIKLNIEQFNYSWLASSDNKGVALLLEPTHDFYESKLKEQIEEDSSLRYIFGYFKPYKKLVGQILLGLLILSLINLSFPFLTKLLVDKGIKYKLTNLLTLILVSQLFLFVGATTIGFIRNWITLHISTKISLNIISDFLIKLLRLPLKFFDSKSVGDLTQRINDHHRIEAFLTVSTVDSLFSIFNIVIFTIILASFNLKIFFLFILFSVLAMIWATVFQRKRKQLDYIRFQRNKNNQDKLYEFILGMQEIKLNGSETYKRWDWERQQIKLFKLNVQGLTLEQYQKAGYLFFTNLKNIIASYIAAIETINGNMSLGVMLSVSFIIGQTNGPLEQLINFFLSLQDAKISMDRLKEIQNKKSEDELIISNENISPTTISHNDIELKNLSFQYEGKRSPLVLKNVNTVFPKGKITAIVGESGSGKTTLLKIILGFYSPTNGKITIANEDLQSIIPKLWRQKCGTVLQDGYIFSDSIAKNIAADGKEIDIERFKNAIETAKVDDFVENLPLKYSTKIGATGIGLSGGQKQRVLIARAIYKNPYYLFLDEATSSLDANNEKEIMHNLNNFFIGKTVIIVAHRLSTVKNADQIIVMEKGEIVELGKHEDLILKRGKYYRLIKNQLEL